jgi:hypothetical protein
MPERKGKGVRGLVQVLNFMGWETGDGKPGTTFTWLE